MSKSTLPTDQSSAVDTVVKVFRDARGRVLPGSTLRISVSHHRDAIRAQVGPHGERIWAVLAEIAEGRPWTPVLPDGRQTEPIAPTAADRTRAAQILAEHLVGRPGLSSEPEDHDVAAVRALSDEELDRRVAAIYAGRAAVKSLPSEIAMLDESVEDLIDSKAGEGSRS